MRFLRYNLVSSSFLVPLWYSFWFFLSFHVRLFDSVRFQYPQVFKFPFLWAFWFFLDLIVLFFPLFVIFSFPLSTLHYFLSQMASLYPDCISSMPVLGFPILFHFWQTVWCHPCTLGSNFFLAIYEVCNPRVFLKYVIERHHRYYI